MENEKILCAAIWFKDFPKGEHGPINISKGLVLCGYRHVHIVSQVAALHNKHLLDCKPYIHGFLTSAGRFVDRKQGAIIFAKTGGVFGFMNEELFSEDLY